MDQKWIVLLVIIILVLIIIVAVNNNNNENVKSSKPKISNTKSNNNQINDENVQEKILTKTSQVPCSQCPDPCPTCPDCNCPPPPPPCPGGIGSSCTLNADCVNGLSCVTGPDLLNTCVCPKPDPPTITSITFELGKSTITWAPSVGASSYNIFIFGPSPQTFLFYVGTTLELILEEGLYSILIYGVSLNCGEGLPTFGQFTIGFCAADANCPNGFSCDVNSGQCIECITDTGCQNNSNGSRCFQGNCVECTEDVQCPRGYVCRGLKCVQCTTNSDCPNGQVCSDDKCIVKGCVTNLECPDPLVCNGEICVPPECVVSADCAGNPKGEVCLDNLCVECLTAADCGGAPNTCIANKCCNLIPPVITAISSQLSSNSQINVTYTSSQNLTGLKIVYELSDPVSTTPFYTSPELNTNSLTNVGQITITQLIISQLLFPNIAYRVRVKVITSCGATDYSNGSVTTMPTQPIAGVILTQPGASLVNTTGLFISVGGGTLPPLVINSTLAGYVVSRNASIHPNLAQMVTTFLPQIFTDCNDNPPPNFILTSCVSITWGGGWINNFNPVPGETVYVRVYLANGYDAGVPGSTGSISALSSQQPFVVQA